MKKPYVLASLMTVPLALTIAGCGPDREEEEVSVDMENGEEPAKPESLTIWANDEEAGLEATREILENYEEKTGIEVTIQAEAMLEQTEQISLDGPGGSGPDLFYQPMTV
ncbi:hypothetical protein [Thalassobacillus sp. C254]|uniref:hypothetical protein n=1 Tax=Thalassobacillus sp. C254 TaxID=1225341 RepID=UPI0022B74588|nr:hypothetical protein [Thalassobacillus sp. C254]